MDHHDEQDDPPFGEHGEGNQGDVDQADDGDGNNGDDNAGDGDDDALPEADEAAAALEAGVPVGVPLGTVKPGGGTWPSLAGIPFATMTDAERERSLVVCSRDGDKEHVLELLQQWSVPPNCHDVNGSTALHFAAARGHTGVGAALLDNGADIDWRDTYGTTALHGASWCGFPEFVDMLLSRGADPLIEGGSGMARLGGVQWYRKRASDVVCQNATAVSTVTSVVAIRSMLMWAEAWARRRVVVIAISVNTFAGDEGPV